MGKHERTVSFRPDGQWSNRRDGAECASSLHRTQKEAADEAKPQIVCDGGGELNIMGEDGQIRNKDTIAPGSDPNPRKDRGHRTRPTPN